MNSLNSVTAHVKNNHPQIKLEVDLPATPQGISWLDLHGANGRLSVEHRPSVGFGLHRHAATNGGFEGPDEVFLSDTLLLERLDELIPELN